MDFTNRGEADHLSLLQIGSMGQRETGKEMTNTNDQTKTEAAARETHSKTLFGDIHWLDCWDAEIPISGRNFKATAGDIVVNGWASIDNPNRCGIYLRSEGSYIVLWNGNLNSVAGGKREVVWNDESPFKVIGSVAAFALKVSD